MTKPDAPGFAVKPKFKDKANAARPSVQFGCHALIALLAMLTLFSNVQISHAQVRLASCPNPSPQRVQVRCAELGFHHKYRTMDGSCNNLGRPHWGSAGVPLLRLLPPRFDDAATQGATGPNPRAVSQAIVASHQGHTRDDQRHSAMLAHFGQFIAHDMTLAKEVEVDCSSRDADSQSCLNIQIPINEITIPRDAVFPFKRSVSCLDGGLREQMNSLTAYLDGSPVYGSDRLSGLRQRERFPRDDGRLRENPIHRSPLGRGFMVFDEGGEMDCRRNRSKANGMECFLAGDRRANEQLMLTATHTVMLREHNRIATQLGRINPEWPGETVFQETRKILAAIIQHIAFKEWLPKILGPLGMDMLGPYEGYDTTVNSGIANSISAAAMRFGHTLVVPSLERADPQFRRDRAKPFVRLRDAFFSPEGIVRDGGIEPLVRGALTSPVKDISAHALVTEELTNHLFPSAGAFPLDLGALNIQRGRDHALPLYNEWRSLCGLDRIHSWAQMRLEARDARAIDAVQRLYDQPQHIDLWVGGLLEKPLRGGKVGRTFSCLLADQFKRLRQGDRFWHENPGVFGLKQMAAIKKYGLSKLLCHNLDDSITMPADAFVHYPSGRHQFVSCGSLPDLDLRLWRIESDGMSGSFECSSPDCTCRYQIGSWGPCEADLQRRHDLLVSGHYPPCTAQRTVARPCPKDDAQTDVRSRDGRFGRPSPRRSRRRRVMEKRRRVLLSLSHDSRPLHSPNADAPTKAVKS